MTEPRTVAIVLPPGEGFGPQAVGAVGLLVQRLAAASAWRSVVVGAPQRQPLFPGIDFRAATPPLLALGRGNRRYALGVAALLRRLRPALVEVHNKPEVALALARRCPGVPVTLFLHNDPQEMRGAGPAAGRAALLARVTQLVTVSEFLRQRLLEGLDAPPRPPVVLANHIDLAALPPPAQRSDSILFAGRLVADKGADSFVAACARALPALPGWRAEMIGADRFRADSPETPFTRALRPRAAAAGIALHGHRPHAEVLRAMRAAAIVVAPSRFREPFGLTALEAMACGAALVCSRRGGLPEVAGDAAAYVDPDDPPAIADAIQALARDPARRAALAAAGRARAERFDLRHAVAALDALRARLLDGPAPHAATWSALTGHPI
jgi:glycosyltransferase involved in cell wall biosynthesis